MQYIDDISSEIENSLPHTEVTVTIKRHGSRVAKANISKKNTFKYDTNAIAIDDLTRLLGDLIANGFNGTLQLTQNFKDGQISSMTVKHTKTTRYKK